MTDMIIITKILSTDEVDLYTKSIPQIIVLKTMGIDMVDWYP